MDLHRPVTHLLEIYFICLNIWKLGYQSKEVLYRIPGLIILYVCRSSELVVHHVHQL